MHSKSVLVLPLLSFVLGGALVACAASSDEQPTSTTPPTSPTSPNRPPGPAPTPPVETLPRFQSEAALLAYVEEAAAAAGDGAPNSGSPSASSSGGSSGTGGASSGSDGTAGGSPPSNDEVTNNQEAGVDEGGIVKNVGDALVVLRKGRLYAVDVSANGAPRQTDTTAVAPSDALNSGVWYDEMLVKGDRVYVVGYRYGVKPADPKARLLGATEIESFRLTGGRFERLRTSFFESNDYFSGRNYASRMREGKLVFYMPSYAVDWSSAEESGSSTSSSGGSSSGSSPRRKPRLRIPQVLEADASGAFRAKGPLLSATDVFVPVERPRSFFFHTMVQCELPDSGDVLCDARAVFGDWWRQHYVTPDAAYLSASRHVYRFRFDDRGADVHASSVVPTDQFSFRADGGVLSVFGNEVAMKPGSSYPQQTGRLLLESLPLASFDARGTQPRGAGAQVLSDAPAQASNAWKWVHYNRFVGPRLFAAVSSYSAGTSTNELLAVDVAGRGVLSSPTGYVSRIEPLGAQRALVVSRDVSTGAQGPASQVLRLHAYPTSGPLTPSGEIALDGLAESERRSHGFFFKPSAGGGGTFGLPIVAWGGTSTGWWSRGIANIGFFDLAPSGALGELGAVASEGSPSVCEVSCVDWYGNTRPVFLRDRVFALMGSELVEVSTRPGVTTVGARIVLTR